jgi:ribonuclease VapC
MSVVLDASALLVLINEEPGHQVVMNYLSEAIMSAVNYTEVLTVLIANSVPLQVAEEITSGLLMEIVPFDAKHAMIAADLRTLTKPFGLSLGDRACLALGKERHAVIVTADKIWKKIELGTEIVLIR